MDKFVIRSKRPRSTSSSDPDPMNVQGARVINESAQEKEIQGNQSEPQEISINTIVADPGLRKPLHELAKNSKELEIIRRAYLLKGPCQRKLDNFPQSMMHGSLRRFCVDWYREFHDWLEYSESQDAAYCLYCYLFKSAHGDQGGGGSFVSVGYRTFTKKEGLSSHEGRHDSSHNRCRMACDDLKNRSGHIDLPLESKTRESKSAYRIRLRTTTKAIRFLLRQGQAFRGHDESRDSLNQGNFIELLKLMAEDNKEVESVVLDNAPGNCILKSPVIQKDIISAFSHLVSKTIVCDMGDEFFALLVDEARDVSIKEQMAVALRYVNNEGCIIERFLGIVRVPNPTARCLKDAIESLLSTFGLSLSRVRGQGYDGASNMQGEFKFSHPLNRNPGYATAYVHSLTALATI